MTLSKFQITLNIAIFQLERQGTHIVLAWCTYQEDEAGNQKQQKRTSYIQPQYNINVLCPASE